MPYQPQSHNGSNPTPDPYVDELPVYFMPAVLALSAIPLFVMGYFVLKSIKPKPQTTPTGTGAHAQASAGISPQPTGAPAVSVTEPGVEGDAGGQSPQSTQPAPVVRPIPGLGTSAAEPGASTDMGGHASQPPQPGLILPIPGLETRKVSSEPISNGGTLPSLPTWGESQDIQPDETSPTQIIELVPLTTPPGGEPEEAAGQPPKRFYPLERHSLRDVAALILREVLTEGVSAGWEADEPTARERLAELLITFNVEEYKPGVWMHQEEMMIHLALDNLGLKLKAAATRFTTETGIPLTALVPFVVSGTKDRAGTINFELGVNVISTDEAHLTGDLPAGETVMFPFLGAWFFSNLFARERDLYLEPCAAFMKQIVGLVSESISTHGQTIEKILLIPVVEKGREDNTSSNINYQLKLHVGPSIDSLPEELIQPLPREQPASAASEPGWLELVSMPSPLAA